MLLSAKLYFWLTQARRHIQSKIQYNCFGKTSCFNKFYSENGLCASRMNMNSFINKSILNSKFAANHFLNFW